MTCRRTVLSLILSVAVSFAFAPRANAQSPPDSNAQLMGCANIMPLGDSITVGTNGGYRNDLFTGLQQDNCGVTYVGTQYDPTTQVADKHHEGHPFFDIADIAANVDNWIASDQPNIVVLMIGTNDVAWWSAETADQIGARHDALIAQIENDRPDAWIFVASIPPESSALIPPNNVDRATLATQVNTVIEKNVATRASTGQHVRFVDVNAALTVNDLSADGIHPLEASYPKIAHTILQSIGTTLGSSTAMPTSASAPTAPTPSTPTPATPPTTAAPAPAPAAAPTTPSSAPAASTPPSQSHGGAFDLISIMALIALKRRRAKGGVDTSRASASYNRRNTNSNWIRFMAMKADV